MPSHAEEIQLGPFTGGLNNTIGDVTGVNAEISTVDDTELVSCSNFELTLEGALASRPPLIEDVGHANWTERIKIIGSAVFPSSGTYLIGANANGSYQFNGTSWTLIDVDEPGTAAGIVGSDIAIQYKDTVFILPLHGQTRALEWSPTLLSFMGTTIPGGSAAVFYKERLWIVPGRSSTTTNSSRIVFSEPILTPLSITFPSTNFIDVSPGDGQILMDIVVHNDDLLLFKEGSTYVFAYDILPSDGVLTKINPNIGSPFYRCVAQYENATYVYHDGSVYELVNYNFEKLNDKVMLELDTTGTNRDEKVFLCIFGNRLVVRYYNKLYVFGLKTRSWSIWVSSEGTLNNFGPLTAYPNDPAVSAFVKFYAGSSLRANLKTLRIEDGATSTIGESSVATPAAVITCLAVTKKYDFNSGLQFKKLLWWAADVFLSPDTYTQSVSGTVTTTESTNTKSISVTNAGPHQRQLAKFPVTSKRFRDVRLTLQLETSGKKQARLYSMYAIVGRKQVRGKEIS